MAKFEKGNRYGKGRPKGSGYIQRCKDIAEKKGGVWDKLEHLANGKAQWAKKDRWLRFEAMRTLLAYGYGKPRQAVEVSPDEDSLSLLEWLGTIKKKRKRK